MKILGISGSHRDEKTSSTYRLVKTVLDATELEYELVSLRGKKIHGCIACLGCVKDNVCVVEDDMSELRSKFVEADAYVIGAANYYSVVNAVTHSVLERLFQFRHREGEMLWGKLAVAVGVAGGNAEVVVDSIEQFMGYNFVETIAKVSGQGAACCFTCGYGESCKIGVPYMLYGPDVKITEDIIPDISKQPDVMQQAKEAGKLLAKRLTSGHDRQEVTKKMLQLMKEKFREST